MNSMTASHHPNDTLLEYAYGELSPGASEAVDAHIQSCETCRAALSQIQSVRSVMRQLPVAAAPVQGLESLMAYAEQTAARNRKAAKPSAVTSPRWVWGLVSALTMSVVGVLGWQFLSVPAAPKGIEAQATLAKADAKKANQAYDGVSPSSAAEAVAVEAASPALTEPAAKEAGSDSLGGVAVATAAKRKSSSRDPAAMLEKKVSERTASTGGADARSKDEMARADTDAKALGPMLDTVKSQDFRNAGGSGYERRAADEAPEAQAGAPMGLAVGGRQARSAEAPKPVQQREEAPLHQSANNQAQPPPKSLALPSRSSAAQGQMFSADAPAEEGKFGASAAPPVADKTKGASSGIANALQRLKGGATGSQRTQALKTLCDGYESLGEAASAEPYCDALLREFAASAEAQAVARRRVESPLKAPAAPATKGSGAKPTPSKKATAF